VRELNVGQQQLLIVAKKAGWRDLNKLIYLLL
jgi:hypothetical protein